MTTQHTPGPWAISKPIGGNVYIEKGNRLIGHIYRDNREANARLIAAAPDLLAALVAIDWDDSECDDPKACAIEPFADGVWQCTSCLVRAAIAKATGGDA